MVVLGLAGCATVPYHYGAAGQYHTSDELAASSEPQITRGSSRPVIDGVGWVVGIPGKLILWDQRVDNHCISPETEESLARYLAANELETVNVRLNEYAPLEEWQRLVANKAVGWGWRYTLGTLAWVEYTVLPGRIFGGDHYDPYTNTISLYSDVPSLALHEGGHAKDFARREYQGTYAAVYHLPGVPLWHEAVATNDALGYLRAAGTLAEEQEAYRILYPAYGTYVGGTASHFLGAPADLAVFAAAVIPAHVAGRFKAHQLEEQRPKEDALPAR